MCRFSIFSNNFLDILFGPRGVKKVSNLSIPGQSGPTFLTNFFLSKKFQNGQIDPLGPPGAKKKNGQKMEHMMDQ